MDDWWKDNSWTGFKKIEENSWSFIYIFDECFSQWSQLADVISTGGKSKKITAEVEVPVAFSYFNHKRLGLDANLVAHLNSFIRRTTWHENFSWKDIRKTHQFCDKLLVIEMSSYDWLHYRSFSIQYTREWQIWKREKSTLTRIFFWHDILTHISLQ